MGVPEKRTHRRRLADNIKKITETPISEDGMGLQIDTGEDATEQQGEKKPQNKKSTKRKTEKKPIRKSKAFSLDVELARRMRIQALNEDRPVCELVEEAFKDYLKKKGER